MTDHDRARSSPGSELVRRNGTGADVPRALVVAADVAVGAASQATRAALRAGVLGWRVTAAGGRAVAGLPGAGFVTGLAESATRPLADEGRRLRRRALPAAEDGAQRALEVVVPAIAETLDIDQLVSRIDIDALVSRIDIDALVRRIVIDDVVSRIEIDQLVSRIDIDALVSRIAIDQLVSRIDVDAVVDAVDVEKIVARIDVNEVVQRVDIDTVVEETELGTIVAKSTTGFASEAVDAARAQTVGVDNLVSRAVNRVLRRGEGAPLGPPLLVGEEAAEAEAAAPEGGDEGSPPSAEDAP